MIVDKIVKRENNNLKNKIIAKANLKKHKIIK